MSARRRSSFAPTSPGGGLLGAALGGLSDAELDALLAQYGDAAPGAGGGDMRVYQGDPVAYMAARLQITLWSKQLDILRAVARHQRVLVRACHGVGKTYVIAAYALYLYECFNPSITLTTAPTGDQVVDLIWKQMRAIAPPGVPFMPALPQIKDPSNTMHYAKGLTTRTEHSFQGRHEEKLTLLFDEAVGIHKVFWRSAEGMLTGDEQGSSIVAIFNPTDTSSVAYENDRSTQWHSIAISALDHPNVLAELAGLPPPFPKAVRLQFINSRVADPRWCMPLASGERHLATDFEWPPGSGTWYRPGADFESKVLGRWPTKSIGSVWSDAAFDQAATQVLEEPLHIMPQIGCDVGRFGDDQTAIHARRGPCSLAHQAYQGNDLTETAFRLQEMAGIMGLRAGVDPKRVPIAIDDTGVGGGVTDILRRAEYTVEAVNAMETAFDPDLYPNRRSELWFGAAERAMLGRLDLTRLSGEDRDTLRRQVMAPRWRQDSLSRRTVEPKDATKRRLGRSPDDADGFNLAYSPTGAMAVGSVLIAGATPPSARLGTTPRLLTPTPAPAAATGGLGGGTVAGLRTEEAADETRGKAMALGAVTPPQKDSADPWLVALGQRAGDPRLALLSLMGQRAPGEL